MSAEAKILLKSFFVGLMMRMPLTLEQWAEKYRLLDSKGSAEPGPFSINRTPYMREIYYHLSMQSDVQEIVAMKGVQLAFTEAGYNWIGYNIDEDPCPMMIVMPTLDTMKRNVKQRIDPMIESTPQLKAKVGGKRSRDGGNTLFQKDYTGGALIMTGANSAAGLRSIAVKKIMFDEVDAYPGDADGEGDPMSLAEKRQSTFGSRKKTYRVSTPKTKGQSKIEAAFERTDQRYYYVPCPHCDYMQQLVFEQLKWEPNNYKDVHYECAECKGKIYNRHKTYMLARGEWRVTKPENINPIRVGYHINTLYSPDGWISWTEIAMEWDAAQGDETKLKAFVNTILGLTYEEESEAPDWEVLYERARAAGMETNKPMSSVAFLTAGVDIQADRIEVEIAGWMEHGVSQQIDYRVLQGDVDKPEVWQKLSDVLNETWKREDGSLLGIKYMAVDTGYKATLAYNFCKKWGTNRVIPIKGQDGLQIPYSAPKAVNRTKAGKNLNKVKVWHVGVSLLKGQLYGWLKQRVNPETGEVPKGYCYFTQQEDTYFRGLTAEALTPETNKRGQTTYSWVVKYKRNEPLDLRVYNMFCYYLTGADRWSAERWAKELGSAMKWVEPEEKSSLTKRRRGRKRDDDGYWNR